jgi:micrococcal nuclease
MKRILFTLLTLILVSANVCKKYEAHVESVYDGDTITCDISVGFDIIKDDAKIRLYGINAPELRGVERPQGLVARDALRQLIDGKDITLKDHGTGKYGRIVGEIWVDTINVCDWMVRNGYAVYKDY